MRMPVVVNVISLGVIIIAFTNYFSHNHVLTLMWVFGLLAILFVAVCSILITTTMQNLRNLVFFPHYTAICLAQCFFIGLAIETDLLFGWAQSIVHANKPLSPISSIIYGIVGLLFIIGGIGASLNVIHIMTHPCRCRKCNQIRIVYAADMILAAVGFCGTAYMINAYYPIEMKIPIAILQCIGAVHLTAALLSLIFIAGNRKGGITPDRCSRITSANLLSNERIDSQFK